MRQSHMSGARQGAVARRGLPAHLLSRTFSLEQLERAVAAPRHAPVYVDISAAGYLCVSGERGAEHVAAAARLAPHVHAAHAELCLAVCPSPSPSPSPAVEPRLQLRVVRELPPLHELLLWFAEELRAAVDMPFLGLRNIRGRKNYECHECGEPFEEPNPLKTHLFLRCGAQTPARLWRHLAARLRAPPSAFRRVRPASGGTVGAPAGTTPGALPAAAAARLEALAAEWGRAAGGHACIYCGKLYSRKYGLKIHIRTHTGYRPLRCVHCARAFGDPSNLNKHVRLHAAAAGAGPGHVCARCGKRAARRRDLLRHTAHCTKQGAPHWGEDGVTRGTRSTE